MLTLHSKQKELIGDLHRFRIANWGRKTGKTEESIEEIIAYACIRKYSHDKRPKISYVGETRKEAKRIAWDRAKLRTRDLWYKHPNDSNLELYLKNNNLDLPDGENYSIVYFDGWENIDAVVGEEFDFVILDEVAKFRNFWFGWQSIIRATLTPRKGHALMISRPHGMNHWKDICDMELENDNYKTFHATCYDNPHIDREEIEEARAELPEDRFAQEYLAEFRKKTGLVYKEFGRDIHVFGDEELKDLVFTQRLGGVDFGFKNPAAVPSIGVDRHGEYWIYDEFYKTGKTDIEIAEYVAAKAFNIVYPDPESPGAIKELENKKVNVRDVLKGRDSIKNGVDKVRELLKSVQLHVHKSCVNIISEFETYSYPDSKDGKHDSENPMDEDNHAMDAIRYVVTMHSYKKPQPKRKVPFHDNTLDLWRGTRTT